jgi:hypothetical protein
LNSKGTLLTGAHKAEKMYDKVKENGHENEECGENG